MNIVEFAERVCNFKLYDWQKKFRGDKNVSKEM